MVSPSASHFQKGPRAQKQKGRRLEQLSPSRRPPSDSVSRYKPIDGVRLAAYSPNLTFFVVTSARTGRPSWIFKRSISPCCSFSQNRTKSSHAGCIDRVGRTLPTPVTADQEGAFDDPLRLAMFQPHSEDRVFGARCPLSSSCRRTLAFLPWSTRFSHIYVAQARNVSPGRKVLAPGRARFKQSLARFAEPSQALDAGFSQKSRGARQIFLSR